jgi:hypothetical protein
LQQKAENNTCRTAPRSPPRRAAAGIKAGIEAETICSDALAIGHSGNDAGPEFAFLLMHGEKKERFFEKGILFRHHKIYRPPRA